MEPEIQIYEISNGQFEILVKVENEIVWLTQKQMSDLFEKDTDTIGLHLKNIYQTGELEEITTTEDLSVVQIEGKRRVKRTIKHYNLDAIISVGYRVNSIRGVQFRKWANKIIKEYLIKGFSLNQKVLTQQNEKLKVLQESIKILGNILDYKVLSNDESVGLLKIISDYSYALDVLDRYDYQTLNLEETNTNNTIYILT